MFTCICLDRYEEGALAVGDSWIQKGCKNSKRWAAVESCWCLANATAEQESYDS